METYPLTRECLHSLNQMSYHSADAIILIHTKVFILILFRQVRFLQNRKIQGKANFVDQRLTRVSRNNIFQCICKHSSSNKILNNVIYYFHTNKKAHKKVMIWHL